MGEQLTDQQAHALKTLDSWRKGISIPTATLGSDGVRLATLRTLEALAYVDSERASNGIFWRLTNSGRTAIRSHNHGRS